MGYGFDLQEWVSDSQLRDWADYMKDHLGWSHLLWGRGFSNASLDVMSYSGTGPSSYSDVVNQLNQDASRPHLYEERFLYTRWDKYDMDTTRHHMWWYAMAGGMGGFWGRMWSGGPAYPNPEHLRAHQTFWADRFRIDFTRANALTDGVALKSPANRHYVFYRDDAASIRMDLSGMSGSQPAIAIDTRKEYAEISLGTLSAVDQTWNAPYSSDWVIAVGDFSK